MSRLPPLPPGLPPKPTGDSYRPGVSQHENPYASHERERERDRDREPLYRFGAGDSYDSRSSYGRRSPPRYDSYTPGVSSYSSAPYGPPPSYGRPPLHSSADVYRPQTDRQSDRPPTGEFSFRHAPPPSIDARSYDLYRSRSPLRRQSGQAQENHKSYNNNPRAERQRHGGQRGAHGYRGRGGPRMASDREFLKGNRAPTPELMQGMEEDGHDGVRYKAVEDMSDSEEAEMEMSEDEEDHDDGLPKKKVKIEVKAADGDSAPRWSNPDPYTVLPPVDESQRKKKDVVKLIRKARVEVSAGCAVKSEATADDFISLDFGDDDDFGLQEDPASNSRIGQGVAGAPAGPRAMLQQPPAPSLQAANSQNRKENGAPGSSFRPIDIPSKPNNVVDLTHNEGLGSQKHNAESGKKAKSRALDTRSDPNLGSRKRNADDELKPPPNIHKTVKGKPPPVNGKIVKEWSPRPGQVATPWIILDHSDTANMGVWLHKEIVDFYTFVRPESFESVVRTKLIENLRAKVQQHPNYNSSGADILPFGSFPAGLYLPTADMDLVCVSRNYIQDRKKVLGQSPSQIRKFGNFVVSSGLALPGSLELILKAKVPLVKYIDRITGLKVDISFENDTGLIANGTFQDWKLQYPAMPILVTLIKHLLAMRGLNEPVNGGIGGFSVTCLVVSLLQNMPQVQSRTMIPEHHLGEILMEFFDLYGNQFDLVKTAIQFDPPGYVSKSRVASIPYKPRPEFKFSIIDPNNSSNDIAGGASNSYTICKFFSQAFSDLSKRMSDLQFSQARKGQSLLECILGGNYESFALQRNHLQHIHDKLYARL